MQRAPKKPADWSYELHVFGPTPRTLPLEDFAELGKRLAELLGSRDQVRFSGLRRGSARLFAKVLEPAQQAVTVQLLRAKADDGPGAGKVIKLNDYLSSRGWSAELRNPDGGVVMAFPGALTAPFLEPERLVSQPDTLLGQVIKIGGRDETVPMTVRTPAGGFIDVTVRGRDLAKKLAQHLFGADVRLSGLATWRRDNGGNWTCDDLVVQSFDEPATESLSSLFLSLRDRSDNTWNHLDDPVAALKKYRENDQ